MGLLEEHFLKQYYNRPSKVAENQKIFGERSVFIHMRNATDRMIYRGSMGLSVVGLGFTFYTIYMMATNQMKKPSR